MERQQLNTIRAELDFHMSGEVDDSTAQALGRMAGAQIIISGAVSRIGDLYRLRIRALNVQSAQITGQFNRNIPNGPTVSALASSKATGYGGDSQGGVVRPASPADSSGTAARNTGGGSAASAPVTNPASSSGSTGAGTVSPATSGQTQPGGLYVGNTFQGAMDLLDALDWITVNAKTGGNYTIALGRDEAITPTELDYGGKALTITLKSAGGKRTVSFAGQNPGYSLFIVKSGVTFTLEEGVTLSGTQNNAVKSLVRVSGGRFIMNGGVITGNKSSDSGGGVRVDSGAFTMNNGTISGNTSGGIGGGGVYAKGTFTIVKKSI